MCLGNRADNSAHYINSQLVVAWENARRCTEKHGTGLKPTRSEVEYGTCLFEFYGPGNHNRLHPFKKELPFFATFEAPHVEFVCNHEVILYLTLKEGHYCLDTAKFHSKSVEEIHDFKFAFRLDFHTHSVNNVQCAKIGNDDSYSMNLLILDIATAVFSADLSNLPGVTTVTDEKSFYLKERRLKALTYYLTEYYLPVIQRAGLHVLHSLPDFDNLRSTSAHIDYSVISKSKLATRTIFGVNIDDVNAYLKGLWLQAAAHIDEHGVNHHDHQEMLKHHLAEHRSVWSEAGEDIHFQMVFGPLQIQAMCKREVVLYLDVQDVQFHVGAAFKEHHDHQFSDWKIAVIVDITFEQVEDDYVKRIHLDLSSARFCDHLSKFSGEISDQELFVRLKDTLVRYISDRYLSVVQRAGHHCVYHDDVRIRVTAEGGSSSEDETYEECNCEDEDDCGHPSTAFRLGIIQKRRITHTHTHDYDQIFAVTQGAVNVHLKKIWQLAVQKVKSLATHVRTYSSKELEMETCLAEYSLTHSDHGEEVFFNASFSAPQIQLLYSGQDSKTVVFYLHLRDGFLKTLAPGKKFATGGTEHTFSNWGIAFTVNLKLRNSHDGSDVPESIMKSLNRANKSTFKQLVLDFSTATFSVERSHVPGLLDGDDYKSIRYKFEAIMYYMKEYYFKALIHGGHDILYTVPMWDKSGHGNHAQILTALNFQIYPFPTGMGSGTVLQGLIGKYHHFYDRNSIVFLGMTGHRELPHGHLPLGCNFIGGPIKSVSQGSITLSRSSFLDARLLSLLTIINKDTTILPSFSGVEGGDWILKLTTWGRHERKKNNGCTWKEVTHGPNSLDFEWKNRDEWRYEHEGDFGGDGHYSVRCATHNALLIPTTQKTGSLAIHVKGKVQVNLAYEGMGKDWRSEMTASWTGAILLTSDATYGLKVELSPVEIVPEFHVSRCEVESAQTTIDSVLAQLRSELPVTLDFKGVLHELRSTFQGVQAQVHCSHTDLIVVNPVFTRRGDLMLELAIRAHEKKAVKKQNIHHAVSIERENSWFRKVTDKVGEVLHASGSPVSVPPPNYSPPSTLSRMSKKSVTTEVVRNGHTASSTTVTANLHGVN